MDYFKLFYRTFYLETNGFIPAKPLNQMVYPGDFFQIVNGEIIVYGNIFRNGIVDIEKVQFDYGEKLNPVNWEFSKGMRKPYAGRGTGQNSLDGEFSYSKQILAFEERGDFSFKGFEPEAVKFSHWNHIKDELLIKLTQVIYSFRELYVVTEVATVSDWTLAIAGSDKAELEIAMNSENFGLVDIFGHADTATVQARDIEYYNREEKRKPIFFKSKKLKVENDKVELFMSDLIGDREIRHEWAKNFFEYEFYSDAAYYSSINNFNQASVLDLLQANQLNPNTVLSYFNWADANLDDVELLFK